MIKKRIIPVFLLLTLILLNTTSIPMVIAYGNNPNDQYLRQQWGWLNIYADVAYCNGYRGNSSILVAVIDSGIDLDHPDLQANIFTNEVELSGIQGVDDDINSFTDDIHGWNFVDNNNDTSDHDGHGSHCAGIIAAIDNTIGICGIAPEVQILPIKVIEVESGDLEILDEAIMYAVAMNADIISLSLGADAPGGPTQAAIDLAIFTAYAAGITLVAAAGNDGVSTVSYPASNSNVIAVAAVTKDNTWASYSNYGSEIEIAAPGGYSNGIISCYNESNYVYSIGTSMATPHVAGVIALMLGQNDTLTPDQIRQKIKDTAIDLGTTGWDEYFGEGLISAAGCLGLPEDHCYNPTLAWLLDNLWWIITVIIAALVLLILLAWRSRRKSRVANTDQYYIPPPEYYSNP